MRWLQVAAVSRLIPPLSTLSMSEPLNKYSRRITQVRRQGASQAMLLGAGLTEEDLAKPQIGIASNWWEGNTCNMHLNDLAAAVKEGTAKADLVGLRFNTIGVSDGISIDRKSTRLNSSHVAISYAVFCLQKKQTK